MEKTEISSKQEMVTLPRIPIATKKKVVVQSEMGEAIKTIIIEIEL